MARTEIRKLNERDIDAAIRLTDLERWGYSPADWKRLLALAPDGCFAAAQDGDVVGVLSTTAYGPIAYLGAVIVRPDLRGQGIGLAMMQAALDHLDTRGVETIRLNAYLNVVPFYERLGFRQEYLNIRWEGSPYRMKGDGVRALTAEDLDQVGALDEPYFGAPRDVLLRQLAAEFPPFFFVAERDRRIVGYAVGNATTGSCEIGPWIVEPDSEDVARPLFAGIAAATAAQDCAFTSPVPNRACDAFARETGFREVFRTMRMVRGRAAHGGRPEGVWALAGLEKG